MTSKFQIESVFTITARDKVVILAKSLDNETFHLTDNSMLGNVSIEKYADIPRAHDKDGNPRLDLFAFFLKHKEDKDKFTEGLIVELHN
jgi:hypothetical protein